MTDLYSQLNRPNQELFFTRNDPNDPRLGEIVAKSRYEDSHIVIIGCPQDEGIRRNHGRPGAASAPDKIREQFYKLTDFGITRKICDLGNVIIQKTLEDTHDVYSQIAARILRDGKKVISLGGGNDISYPDGCAMAEVFGRDNWIGINIDQHFDVRIDTVRHSGTPYRQLLDEKLIQPNYFYEVAYQSQANSMIYHNYLRDLGVNLISLEHLRSKEAADSQLRDLIKHEFVHHSSSINTFFGFDMDAVRSADAPGTSAPSPIGLRAGEFIQLVKYAGSLLNTKMIEFTEVNPNFDIDNRTAKLVAIGMHRFCSSVSAT